MSVSFSCTISEDIHLALLDAMKATKKKRNDFVKEGIIMLLKQGGYLQKYTNEYDD
jgi:hypothetical protein